jgi:hypothetical protein
MTDPTTPADIARMEAEEPMTDASLNDGGGQPEPTGFPLLVDVGNLRRLVEQIERLAALLGERSFEVSTAPERDPIQVRFAAHCEALAAQMAQASGFLLSELDENENAYCEYSERLWRIESEGA